MQRWVCVGRQPCSVGVVAVVWASVSSCCPLFFSLFFVTCPLQELNSSVGRDLQRSSRPTAWPLRGQPELNEGIVPIGHPPPLGNVLLTWTAGLHIIFVLWRCHILTLQMNLLSPTSPWQIGSVWQHRKAKLPFVMKDVLCGWSVCCPHHSTLFFVQPIAGGAGDLVAKSEQC